MPALAPKPAHPPGSAPGSSVAVMGAGGEVAEGVIVPFPVSVSGAQHYYRLHQPRVAARLSRPTHFDLSEYLNLYGPAMVTLLQSHTHRELYRLLTVDQPEALPVSYSYFSRVLAVFRAEQGLPPVRRPVPSKVAAAAATVQPPAPARQPAPVRLPPPAAVAPAPLLAPSSVPPPLAQPEAALPAVASPATILPPPVMMSAQEVAAYVKKRFKPYTAEDFRSGKPISEVVKDEQLKELLRVEQELGFAPRAG